MTRGNLHLTMQAGILTVVVGGFHWAVQPPTLEPLAHREGKPGGQLYGKAQPLNRGWAFPLSERSGSDIHSWDSSFLPVLVLLLVHQQHPMGDHSADVLPHRGIYWFRSRHTRSRVRCCGLIRLELAVFEHAPCKDMDVNVFFPDKNPGFEAKRACFDCAYVRECRLLGLPEPHGIWGGIGQKPRERLGRPITARLTGQRPEGGGDNTPRWVVWRPIAERMLARVDAGEDLEQVMLDEGITQAEINALFADLQQQEEAA